MQKIHISFTKNHNPESRSWQASLALSLGCFLLALIFSQGQARQQQEALAARLAPSVLRFHILAESDARPDQQVKLEIRSLVLDFLKEELSRNADKEKTMACLSQNQEKIEAMANAYLKQRGFDYQASLQLTSCYFPARIYGDYVFPCGYYDAARITLGKGEGHNWWCVLYPQFCFVDEACTSVPKESASRLEQELKEDDYLALKNNRPDVEIRFFLFPRLSANMPEMSFNR